MNIDSTVARSTPAPVAPPVMFSWNAPAWNTTRAARTGPAVAVRGDLDVLAAGLGDADDRRLVERVIEAVLVPATPRRRLLLADAVAGVLGGEKERLAALVNGADWSAIDQPMAATALNDGAAKTSQNEETPA